ncbi:MAG: hypothetical protein JW863_04400 [Chitinispirillaceae bacterium]|nr:hypothetical protein [Chitinispirillaceae bacterium]
MNKAFRRWIGLLIPLLAAAGCDFLSGPTDHYKSESAPVITGTFLEPDGYTPAKGVLVSVVPRKTTATIAGGGTAKTVSEALVVQTDADGVYRIAAIDAGVYVVEGSDNSGNAVRIDSVVITSDETTTLEARSLQSTGMITGKVVLPETGDPETVFVLAFGCERFAQADSSGNFVFDNMSYGTYELQPVCLQDMYGAFEPVMVTVQPDATVDAGVFSLQVDDVCIPENFICSSYDTVMQTITLQWDPCDDDRIKGYNVYQYLSAVTSDYRQINTEPVSENTFTVNTIFIGDTARFSVSTVLKNGVIGEKSVLVEIIKSVAGPIDTLPMIFGGIVNRLNWINDNELELISYGMGEDEPGKISGGITNDMLVYNRFTFDNDEWTVQSTVISVGKTFGLIDVVDNGLHYRLGYEEGIIERFGADSTDWRSYNLGKRISDFSVFDGYIVAAIIEEKSIEFVGDEHRTIAVYDSDGVMIHIVHESDECKLIRTMNLTSDGRISFQIDLSNDDISSRKYMVYNIASNTETVLHVSYDCCLLDICGDYYLVQPYTNGVYEIRMLDGTVDWRIPVTKNMEVIAGVNTMAVNSNGAVALPVRVGDELKYRILVLPSR